MEPLIDYNAMPAIPYRKTINHVNQFVITSTQFLNRFSCLCEQKLANLSRHIQRLEVTLNILEAKLNSIPGLENVTAADLPALQQAMGQMQQGAIAAPEAGGGAGGAAGASGAAGAPPPPPVGAPPPPPPPEAPPAPAAMAWKDDPRYKSFFKLLSYGAPAQQIKMKMAAAGLNPDVLDTPDAPSDGAGGAPAPAAEGGEGGGGGGEDGGGAGSDQQEDSDKSDKSDDAAAEDAAEKSEHSGED